MIDIHFIYKEKKKKIKCNKCDSVLNVFKKYSSEAKLDFDNLIFFYENKKINLELDLVIEDQFNLNKSKKIKILVFDNISQDEFYTKFKYTSHVILIKCTKNEKIIEIFEKFASKARVNITDLLFLYNGDTITEDDYQKTYYELAQKIDKESKVMTIAVSDYKGNDSISSNSEYLENNNIDSSGTSKNLIIQNTSIENPVYPDAINLNAKYYYLKFFLVLIIQYSFIAFLAWLGFFLKINEKIIKNENTMKWTFISILSLIMILSIIYNAFLKSFKKNIFLYIFHVIYGLFIIINCFLLSKYIDSHYILYTLFLLLIGIIGMEIYTFISKNFKLYFFGLSSFILLMISIIGFYFLIKETLIIIKIYSIGLAFILYLIFIIFISLKLDLCENNEYIYATMIYNYAIFFGISIGLVECLSACIKCFSKCLSDCCEGFCQCLSDCCEGFCQCLSDCCEGFCQCLSDCCGGICQCLSDCCGGICQCLSDCCGGICQCLKDCFECLCKCFCECCECFCKCFCECLPYCCECFCKCFFECLFHLCAFFCECLIKCCECFCEELCK